MLNILPKSTALQPAQPPVTTTIQLAICTDDKKAFNCIAKIEQRLTIRQSIEESPLICSDGQRKNIIPHICKIIEFFLTITGREMQEFQILILAGDLYEKFKTDTIDDIILMFKMARMGDFGKVYKVDNFSVMDWTNAYLERKSEEREKILSSPPTPLQRRGGMESGRYFHELPKELQDKFNNIGKPKQPEKPPFLPPKATEKLNEEKHRREIQKLIDKS